MNWQKAKTGCGNVATRDLYYATMHVCTKETKVLISFFDETNVEDSI
jgi:hypothetical protein